MDGLRYSSCLKFPRLSTYYEGSKGNADVITSRIQGQLANRKYGTGSKLLMKRIYNLFLFRILKNNESFLLSGRQIEQDCESKTERKGIRKYPALSNIATAVILLLRAINLRQRDIHSPAYRLLYIKGN
jgi:hypothetical protein